MTSPVRLLGVRKTYPQGVVALDDVTVDLPAGTMTVAFVFQRFNLMPALTVRQNVTLPATLAGKPVDDGWVTEVLRRVALSDRIGHRPGELSGGQQ